MKWAGKLFFWEVLLSLSFLSNLFAQTGSSLTFSEIMFTPSESNGEFVEIYNTSATDTVDLATYRFKYYTSALDILIAFQGGTKLAPGKFAVVIENDYDWNNGIYKTIIPVGTVVMKISDNSFGTSGMANTTSRDIYLYNTLNQQLDTYTYSANNADGYSDEKITMDKNNNATNWANTLQLYGTPGKKNSVTPADYDLATTITGINPTSPVTEDSVAVTVKVKNLGRLIAANFSVEIFNDLNLDSQGQANERIFTQNYSNLIINDSLLITKKIYAAAIGAYSFVAQSNFTQDEKSTNNKAVLSYNVSDRPASFNDIVINEIMYAPSTDEPEWIEIFNKSNRSYNLKNWKIGDNSSLTTISTSDLTLNANQYLVISDDATIINFYTVSSQWVSKALPSLSNSGDQVSLKDNQNRKIDSLSYQPSWGGNTGGKSLERVSPQSSSIESSNWKSSTSILKATPGRINSVTAKNKDISVKQFTLIGAFAEVGSQIQLKAEIENLGLDNVDNFAIRFYKDDNNNSIGEQNELISEELQQNINTGQIKEFIFNTNNFIAGNNHFLVIVEFGDDQFQDNNSAAINITGYIINELRGDLVINEIMYAPNSSEPEWIEIYNRSSKIIDMLGYKIADDATTTRVINSSLILDPGKYLVIAKDSSIVTLHNNIPLLRTSTFASLNNSGDRVILLDSLNRVIDSLDYKSSWGGSSGKSLERIDANRSSIDSTNWKTSSAVIGSTPGYFNTATPYDNDLAVSVISHSPLLPIKGDSVTVNIKIENIGKNTANNFSLEFFDDINRDSVAQSTERISIKNYTLLVSSAEIITQIKVLAAEVRAYRIIAKLNFSADEVLSNNTAYKEYLVSEIPASVNEIVINEIMYAPSSDEPEWIEIYNRSNRSLNLKDWKIGDNTALAIISSTDFLFSPGEYLVISGDAAISNYYNITSRLLIKSLPSLSNSGDDVKLKDNSSRTIDSVKYLPAWGGNSGKSLERKFTDSLSNRQSNWGTSINSNKATPGKFNSISPLENNLSVSIPSILPAIPIVGDSVSITIKIENIGKNRADNFSVEIFNDLNLDTTPQQTERISIKNISLLNSFSSTSFQIKVHAAEIRVYRILVKVNYSQDEDLSDNSAMKEFSVAEVPAYSKEIVVNEIMYAPSNDEPEWLELMNKSNRSLNLKNWKIGDNTALVIISTLDYILNPGEYLIISSDSTISNYYQITSKLIVKAIPSLSNSGDDVILKSNLNTTIDSVKYFSTWGGTGNKSLERIGLSVSSNDPLNWKTSRSRFRATPGKINSVTAKTNDLSLKSVTAAAKYVEIDGNVKLNIVVENLGTSVTQNYSIRIYKDLNFDNLEEQNELVGEIAGSSLALSGTKNFDFTVTHLLGGVNQIIVKIEFANDEFSENNIAFFRINGVTINELKGDLVINEIMYAPASSEQEWIEIYNKSTKQINLKGYKISNLKDTTEVINTSTVLQPEEYFVIAKDTTTFSKYPRIPKLIVTQFPTLNNSGEKVILLDSLNRAIDSLAYKSTWGGAGGKSLERIEAALFSTDSTNWKTSANINGATPGYINSVSLKNYDVWLPIVRINPKNPIMGESVKINVGLWNPGKKAASFVVKLNEIMNNGQKILLKEINVTLSATIDVLIFRNDLEYIINNLTQTRTFEYYAFFPEDQDTTNNRKAIVVQPGYAPGSVVVNEIMYTPLNGEPEWIELYNNSQYDIDLSDWSITDVLTTPVKTKIQSKDYIFPSKTFLVVAKDSTIINYHSLIPSKLIISSFANLNNDADGVVLKDSRDVTIDSVRYSSFWGGTNGKSLERINVASSSTDSTNWKSSKDTNGSTPGLVNSLSKKNYDISVNKILTTPVSPLVGQKVSIKSEIVNTGKQNASFKIILNELKKDGSKQKLEESAQLVLSAGSTLNYDFLFSITNILTKRLFEVVADYPGDEDQTNNNLISAINPGYSSQMVLLNEIMYTPLNGEPEWIELYNNSQYDIDLEDWTISDVLATPAKTKMQVKGYIFPSKTFLVIAKDSTIINYHSAISSKLIVSTFANLNNDADGVVLRDARDVTIDSVRYDSFWGGTNGRSLERKLLTASSLDKNNWASSKDIELSTPGRLNSITQKKFDLSINAISTAPQYPAFNDDVNLIAKVINYGSDKAASFTVKFFLRINNSTTYFSEGSGINLSGSDSTWIVSNVKLKLNDSKTILCKVFFSNDEDTLNNYFVAEVRPGLKRNTVLVSEVMYDPLTGESEWIEIYNASSDAVNLKNWSISDLLPSPTKSLITTKDNLLNPGELAIITNDSLKYPFYPPKKFFQAKFGLLSSADGVMIYDFRNAVIDSLKYNSTWGGAKGFSLERLSFTSATNDSLNWSTTLSPDGGTPGIKNSIVNTPKYSSGSLIINEIMFDPSAGNSEYLEFYNTTGDSIQLGGMEIKVGTANKFKLSNSFFKLAPHDYFVLAADSSIYKNYDWMKFENDTKLAGSSSFNLANDGTTLVLKDMHSTTLDSISYSSAWHKKNIYDAKNRSLERLNPLLGSNIRSNWSTSVSKEGGTPCKQNSIYSENISRESKVTISPNPFSPDNDGFEDFAIINFDLTIQLAQVRIKVFDSQGRLVRTLSENRPSASKNSVIFDGLDDNGRPLRIGIYILLIEAVAEGSGNVDIMKTPIVIARKL